MSGKIQQWTTLSNVKQYVLKKWNNGFILQLCCDPGKEQSLRIPLKYPSSQELIDRFSDAQRWVQTITSAALQNRYTVEFTDINHRTLGRNQLPVALIFSTLDDAVSFISKKTEFVRFKNLSQQLLTNFPQLMEWLYQNVFVIIDHATVLEKLLRATQLLLDNPRPQIYLRQLTIRDIDTKFIESYKKILSQWLDILLDPVHINQSFSGVKGFEARYGFLSKPDTVRFRILDKTHFVQGLSDLTVRTDEFSMLKLHVKKVFVTENDINGLVFPETADSIIIFGRGYGFESLSQVRWINNTEIWYWGDIDTHGFAILNQFRYYFPHTRSLLMDHTTLLAHKPNWVTEPSPTTADLELLTNEERIVYDELRNQKHGMNIRLEQESIPYQWLKAALLRLQ